MSDLTLNYHLMHPGGESAPGDPNAAFYLDGTYHRPSWYQCEPAKA